MAGPITHLKSFFDRLKWLSPMMGGVLKTALHLIKIRGNPLGMGTAQYHNIHFEFRNCDSTAVKEVLIDEEYDFLSAFLKSCPAPIIIDIGAHIGTFSLWVYHQNPKARMLMIEANPASHKILSHNVAKAFPENQYKILNKAAWKNNDVLKFSTAGDSMGNKISPDGDIEVDGITFVEIVEMATENTPSIDLMKIDIEGAEEAFFETADQALDRVKNLVIELHPKSCDTDSVINKLKKRYKNIHEISERIDSKPVLYCTDPS